MAINMTDPYFCASYTNVVRGFHVYKDIWTPVLIEVHPTQQEHGNPEDMYTVSILKDEIIVGNIPRNLSRTC